MNRIFSTKLLLLINNDPRFSSTCKLPTLLTLPIGLTKRNCRYLRALPFKKRENALRTLHCALVRDWSLNNKKEGGGGGGGMVNGRLK